MRRCFECEQCTFANKHKEKVLEHYDIVDMSQCCNVWTSNVQVLCVTWSKDCEKTWKIMSEWNANCYSSATRSLLWWNVSRGCKVAMNASRLEELCCTKRPRFVIGHRQSVVARIARFADAKLQLERRAHWWRVCEWQRQISRLAMTLKGHF